MILCQTTTKRWNEKPRSETLPRVLAVKWPKKKTQNKPSASSSVNVQEFEAAFTPDRLPPISDETPCGRAVTTDESLNGSKLFLGDLTPTPHSELQDLTVVGPQCHTVATSDLV